MTIKQQWILGVLWLLIILTALAIVMLRYHNRNLFYQWQQLQQQQHNLDIQWGQLLLEASTWSDYHRIEQLSQQQFEMRHPEPSEILTIKKPK